MVKDVVRFIENTDFRFIGITGNAGSGKSTLADALPCNLCRVDDFFIGSSNYRKQLGAVKENKGLDSFADFCNMYNWWDWNRLEKELDTKDQKSKTIVEGALLGTTAIINKLDFILFVFTPTERRFQRLVDRDRLKRNFMECFNRFLITEYSEALYYKRLFSIAKEKILTLDSEYNFVSIPENYIYREEQFLPMKVRI